MIAALYVRVSTEDQARHGFSLAAQADACRLKAEELGAHECRLFADEGVSGSILSRPGLQALRQEVRNGNVHIVVVWDPDRLARNLSHQLLLTEEADRAKVRLEFVNFEWRNTPEGQLFYALRGAIAQYEKEKIKERTSRGRLQKAKVGKLPAAFRPYGYDYNPDTSLLVPVPREAAVVECIFTWFSTEGLGPAQIARRLDHMGIPAKRGGSWHRNVVRQILINKVYTGVFYANRWNTAGCGLNRHLPKAERARPFQRPPSDWVAVPVPALVDPGLFAQAQRRLTQARRLWAGAPQTEYLLSSLVTCGQCGRPMAGTNSTRWGKRVRTYTCRRTGVTACTRPSILAEPFERAVWSAVRSALLAADLIYGRDIAGGQAAEAPTARMEAVSLNLANANRGRETMLRLAEQGQTTTDDLLAALQRVDRRIRSLKVDLGMLTEQHQRRPEVAPAIGLLRQNCVPLMAQRKLIRCFVQHITANESGAILRAYAHRHCHRDGDLNAPAQPETGAR